MDKCVICDRAQSEPETIVFENQHWIVRHSKETNIPGYVVIEPRRHFLDLSFATHEEAANYGVIASEAIRAVRDVMSPERVYTFSLGESCPHYHLHVIPRRADFPRAYLARGIMQYPLTPELDSSLRQSVTENLRRAFARSMTTLSFR